MNNVELNRAIEVLGEEIVFKILDMNDEELKIFEENIHTIIEKNRKNKQI